jgi:hypothetical protein
MTGARAAVIPSRASVFIVLGEGEEEAEVLAIAAAAIAADSDPEEAEDEDAGRTGDGCEAGPPCGVVGFTNRLMIVCRNQSLMRSLCVRFHLTQSLNIYQLV